MLPGVRSLAVAIHLEIHWVYFTFTTLFAVYRIIVSLVYSSVMLSFGWFLLLLILRFYIENIIHY
ncbi:hypothetical protein CKY12_08545 [Photorhabdus sp. S12-55]|nr:hypothetical protein A4R40_22630 [Photorhabdus laumondii subsp. laumondii]RAW72667.1 hypothetical protein CKY15_06625 [Photorhabdus sp. S7-51]RAW78904.1 hypothetical protein CKY06_05585 [Photorhabdus sp. S15-56]RAW86376.1 hypothetical protein CKY12_08545 [Photorhabdus sp. S12-55]